MNSGISGTNMAAPIAVMPLIHQEKHDNVFKAHFKYYKKRSPFPNLEDVLDFTHDSYKEVIFISLEWTLVLKQGCLLSLSFCVGSVLDKHSPASQHG